MRRLTRLFVLAAWIAAGCNTLDKPGVNGGMKRIVPTDARPAQQALRALPAISGGTLAVSADGVYAVAADPDRDRISIVTLASGELREVPLEQGDEPGRVVIDPSGRTHVALRRAGDLVSLDLASGQLLQRTHVCSAPRGIAYDATRDLLHVACADGRLVSLNASDVTIVRVVDLQTDLRDVLVRGDQLLVSTFKGAELLSVDAAGVMTARTQPQLLELPVLLPPMTPNGPPQQFAQPMQAHLAWRTLQTSANSVFMLHQDEATNEIKVDAQPTDVGGSAYGGAAGDSQCAGVVTSSVTRLDADIPTQTVALAGITLAVDMAVSPLDGTVAIAQAGVADPQTPRPFTVFDSSGGATSSRGSVPPEPFGFAPGLGQILRIHSSNTMTTPGSPQGLSGIGSGCQSPEVLPIPGQATAVAYTLAGELVAQTREPARLIVVPSGPLRSTPRVIDLGGPSVLDTGHELFHRDSGGGIACASCHGEGAEDGHTWIFSNVGARRTQAVHVGLAGTAPFHWNGDMPNLGALMESVFVGRMGGVHQSNERIAALTHFLFALNPPPPIVDGGDPAAMRGKALFASGEVGCIGCHQGAKFTNNKSYDVGTAKAGELLQVPSLRGVGYRAPFMHTGCAQTLRARFDPSCGGDRHGHTSQLDEAQIDDLIAYLRSL